MKIPHFLEYLSAPIRPTQPGLKITLLMSQTLQQILIALILINLMRVSLP